MPESHPARKSPILPAIVALAAAVALIAALAGVFSGDDEADRSVGSPTDSQRSSTSDDSLARRQVDDPMAKGEADAPVVLIAYSDFQCPFCGKWARDTAPALEEQYVTDGTLRIEWRDFPYLGPESTLAAHAARAAAEQDRFWQFHDALYVDQPAPNSGEVTEERLVEVAREVGLDVDRFRRDLGSQSIADAVQADFTEGQSIGVTGTPAFLVNGRPVMGAQPVDVFRQLIDQGLAEAGSEK